MYDSSSTALAHYWGWKNEDKLLSLFHPPQISFPLLHLWAPDSPNIKFKWLYASDFLQQVQLKCPCAVVAVNTGGALNTWISVPFPFYSISIFFLASLIALIKLIKVQQFFNSVTTLLKIILGFLYPSSSGRELLNGLLLEKARYANIH